MWSKSLFLICFLVSISSEEQSRKHEERKGKLFTFETKDEDIRGAPSININPATLAVGGAIVLGTTILLPFALKNYAHLHSDHGSHGSYYRLLDSAEFSTDAFVEFASQMLGSGKSLQSCALRIACWTAKRNKMDHIQALQGVMSNPLLSTVINSTAVEEAMASGRNGRDCATYSPCPLREEHIPMLFKNIALLTNSIG